ncbi:MAG: class I SAM-dependent methyltransferase [Desulfurococcales archaeon]|nr:class I SAM-dependent methyltransferase [Desulfurococcales archaeon]
MRGIREKINNALRKTIPASEVLRVMEWYDSIAPSYDVLYAREQRSKYVLIDKILKRMNGRVMDVGCGTAEFPRYVCERYSRNCFYVGIDLSFNLLSIARRKLASMTSDSNCIAEFIAGDLLYPPIRDSVKFNFILLMSVLRSTYGVSSIVKFYAENYLGNGGLLALTIMYENENGVVHGSLCPEGASFAGKVRRNEVICLITRSGGDEGDGG